MIIILLYVWHVYSLYYAWLYPKQHMLYSRPIYACLNRDSNHVKNPFSTQESVFWYYYAKCEHGSREQFQWRWHDNLCRFVVIYGFRLHLFCIWFCYLIVAWYLFCTYRFYIIVVFADVFVLLLLLYSVCIIRVVKCT